MTITLFVEPTCFKKFIEVTSILRDLELENSYYFNPSDIDFTEAMISNYIWINMEISEYFKLKYAINKNKRG